MTGDRSANMTVADVLARLEDVGAGDMPVLVRDERANVFLFGVNMANIDGVTVLVLDVDETPLRPGEVAAEFAS